MLAPFLNKGMKQCSDRELLILTTVWGCTISVFSTFLPFFPWSQNDSNIGEFILLYLITGCIKRWNGYGKRIKWVVIWGLSVLALSSSALILHFVAPDHEMFFYRYNSVFVISEAVAVFVLFLPIKVIHEKVQRIIIWVQKGSLAVYLIHMHPLFKEKYTEWKIFDFIKDKNPGIYVAYILITCLFIFGSGTLIGRVISYGGKKIECLVENVLGRLKNYLRKQYGK